MTKEQKDLVTANHNLIYAFLHKNSYSVEEYYDLAAIGMCKAAKTYSSDTRFSTYAFECMKNEIISERRRESSEKRHPQQPLLYYYEELDGQAPDGRMRLEQIPDGVNVEQSVIAAMMMKEAMRSIRGRDWEILRLMYYDIPQREISRRVGCTQGYISKLLARMRRQLAGEG